MMKNFLNELYSRKNKQKIIDIPHRFTHLLTILSKIPIHSKQYKTVHIAGSKGKGSTAIYLNSSLLELGRKTFLFTSPHILNIRERFLLNGSMISSMKFEEGLSWLKNRETITNIQLSFFDAMTAILFYLVDKESIDFLILETGLGGRLDATNICTSDVTIITPIELEHTSILGNTLSKITQEKAGIIKNNIPLFVAKQPLGVFKILLKIAKKKHSPFYAFKDIIKIKKNNILNHNTCIFTYRKKNISVNFSTNLITLVHNAILVLPVLEYLLPHENIYESWEKVVSSIEIMGRYQKIIPFNIIVDGSHTVKSLKYTCKTFKKQFDSYRRVLIFGCAKDKKFYKIYKNFSLFHKTYLVGIQNIEHNMLYHSTIHHLSYYESLSVLLNNFIFEKNTVILITGSFYLVAEALTYFKEKNNFF